MIIIPSQILKKFSCNHNACASINTYNQIKDSNSYYKQIGLRDTKEDLCAYENTGD